MENLLTNYYETVSMILFGIGFTTLLLQKNMIKKVIGINIMDTAIYLFLTAKGYIVGRMAPIIDQGITNVEMYINPIPSGLVLTGIVVSVSVSAFFLALIHKLYKAYGTLDIDEVIERARNQEGKNDQLHT